jgi:hypothetical protein
MIQPFIDSFMFVSPCPDEEQAACRRHHRDSWQVVENRREPAPVLTWCARNRADVGGTVLAL